MSKNNTVSGRKGREPITDTKLLLTITICVFFVMYVLAMLIWGGGFLKPQQFINLFNDNAYLIILSCGLTIVMISGGIDISVGGVTALVTMCCVVFLNSSGGSILGSLCIALGIGLAFGLVQGLLVAYLDVQPFIVTLAGMFFARGMTTIVNKVPATVTMEAFKALKDMRIEISWLGAQSKGGWIPARIELGAVIALVVVLAVFVILRWTRLGRNIYAVGGNNQSALMLGINVKRTKFYAHLFCGLLAGIAGYTFLLHIGAANPAGDANMAEMKAIASSIIGGTLLTGGVGNIIGTLFGTLTLETIRNIVVTSGLKEPWWQSITYGAMLCFFILLQSVVLARRGKGGLALPKWLNFGKKKSDDESAT